jgi:hypothetical protein
MAILIYCFCLQGVVKPTKKGQQRVQGYQDFVDLGDGYDETDPFIDNTDAVRLASSII